MKYAVIVAAVILLAGTLPVVAQQDERPRITSDNASLVVQVGSLGHGQVTDVCWVPRWANALALAGSQGVWLYDADDLEADPRLLSTGPTQLIDIISYGDGLVTASGWRVENDDTVRLWNTETGDVQHILEGHTGRVNSIAAAEYSFMASGGDDGTVRVWDTYTGDNVDVLESGGGAVLSLAFGSYGQVLAIGTRDGVIQIRDMTTGQGFYLQAGSAVHSLAFSPDGQELAAGCADGAIRLWQNQSSFSLDLRVLRGHTGAVTSVAYNADGDLLVSGGADGVQLWNVMDGWSVATLPVPNGVLDVAFNPDGDLLASVDVHGAVQLWAVVLPPPVEPTEEES